MRKHIALTLAIIMVLSSFAFTFAADVTMSDVKSGSWYYDDVTSLVGNGGINGYPDGTFRPNSTISAAEFIKITIAMYERFLDVPQLSEGDKWYTPYVDAAIKSEILPEGMITDYNEPITREKMAVIMERASEKLLKEDVISDTDKLNYLTNKFSDYNTICDYCKEYVIQATGKGIIGGYPDGTFKPQGNATRAEAATMLVRLSYSKKRLSITYGQATPISYEEAQSYMGNYDAYSKYQYYWIEPEDAVTLFKLSFAGNRFRAGRTNSEEYFGIWHVGRLGVVYNDGDYEWGFYAGATMSTLNIDYLDRHIEDVKYFILKDSAAKDVRDVKVYITTNPFI